MAPRTGSVWSDFVLNFEEYFNSKDHSFFKQKNQLFEVIRLALQAY